MIVRQLQSSDIYGLVDVHLEAFRGYMNARLGRRYVAEMFRWFQTDPQAIALVAIDEEGKPLGYVFGAPVGYGPALDRRLWRFAAVAMILRPWLIFDSRVVKRVANRLCRLLQRERRSVPMQDVARAMSLVGIGVARRARGGGVGVRLIQQFEREALRHGFPEVVLSVYSTNAAARRLYEKAGWRIVRSEGDALYYGRTVGSETEIK